MWRIFGKHIMIIIIVEWEHYEEENARWTTHMMMFCVFRDMKSFICSSRVSMNFNPHLSYQQTLLVMIIEAKVSCMQVQYFRLPRGSCRAVIKFFLLPKKLFQESLLLLFRSKHDCKYCARWAERKQNSQAINSVESFCFAYKFVHNFRQVQTRE